MTARFNPHALSVVIIGTIAIAGVVATLHLLDFLERFWDVVEPFLGLGVAGMATLVWLGERKEARIAALPRRLTVHYLHDGDVVHVVERAVLLHEADARQLAQQIGSQLKRSQGGTDDRLAFDATQIFEHAPRGPEKDASGDEAFTIHLSIPLASPNDADLLRRCAPPRAATRE